MQSSQIHFIRTVVLTAFAAGAAPVMLSLTAIAHAADNHASHAGHVPAAATPAIEPAEGEIRKIDTDARKITIKHGEIKNLDMPAMTMVFQLQESVQIGTLKVGDKIKFK
ncbi:MAG TPA: copper-binding protein, partial [Casimicrobium huifangae]|nr:copper-binding protein [Casimicrobium huifangae]